MVVDASVIIELVVLVVGLACGVTMTDARNIAHDKKVHQKKKHQGKDIGVGADRTPQPGRTPHQEHHVRDDAAPTETPRSRAKRTLRAMTPGILRKPRATQAPLHKARLRAAAHIAFFVREGTIIRKFDLDG